jgi:predicted transcriptional regulator
VTTYHVVVTREGDAWLAIATNVDGAHSWAKNLPNLDRDIREAIAAVLDLADGAEPDLDVDYEYRTGNTKHDAMAENVRTARQRLAAQAASVERDTVAAIRTLAARGYSVRDVAALLAVSPQYVSQVAPARGRVTGLSNVTDLPTRIATKTRGKSAARTRSVAASALSQATSQSRKSPKSGQFPGSQAAKAETYSGSRSSKP